MRILSLSHLKHVYVQFLQELYQVESIENSNIFNTSAIKEYIQNTLKRKITFVTLSEKQYVISSAVDIESVADEEINDIIFEQEAEEFAIKYRKQILKIKKKNHCQIILIAKPSIRVNAKFLDGYILFGQLH